MAAPRLNRQLTLESPERIPDGGGGWSSGWIPLGTLWAEIEPVSAREPVIGDRPTMRVSHRITVRGAPAASPRRPQPHQRFRSGDRIFAIQGVTEREGRDDYLLCWAEEGALE